MSVILLNRIDNHYQEHEQVSPIRNPAEELVQIAHGDVMKNSSNDKGKRKKVNSWQFAV
ncbi:MAG: hypothetical protein NTX61_03325 [Bacteroidetes bacterium]|nr:hypothetical protein [Bacteroidota bacterium]